MTFYLLTNGPVIKDGHTTDGPGELRWLARELEDPLVDPPRDVLRWYPTNVTRVPPGLLPPKKEPPQKPPKRLWKFGR